MLIVSFKNYVIEIDRLNHTLIEEVISENGKVYRKYLGYFSNMEQVVRHLIKNEQGKSNDTIELKEFLEDYKELSYQVLEDVKGIEIEFNERIYNFNKKEGK